MKVWVLAKVVKNKSGNTFITRTSIWSHREIFSDTEKESRKEKVWKAVSKEDLFCFRCLLKAFNDSHLDLHVSLFLPDSLHVANGKFSQSMMKKPKKKPLFLASYHSISHCHCFFLIVVRFPVSQPNISGEEIFQKPSCMQSKCTEEEERKWMFQIEFLCVLTQRVANHVHLK